MRKLSQILLLVSMFFGFAGVASAEPLVPPQAGAVGLQLVASGLTSPLSFQEVPDGSGRMFIVDQVGLIRILTPDGTLLPEPFLDLTASMIPLNSFYDERGLLSFAFHPDYANNGRFFVYYNAPPRSAGYNNTSTFSEFSVSDDPDLADPAYERIFLQVDKPQGNHNGGSIAFGPDGYLYLTLGDGGGANDVGFGHVDDWYAFNAGGNGQDITQNLLGSVLRLDVDSGEPYAIPADNPFVGQDGLDEIYAYGFRNPYTMTFDKMTGDLYVGDAGQNQWEEVSIVVKGGNYGWNVKEGTHCFDAANPLSFLAQCPDTGPDGKPLIDPVIEYANNRNPFTPGLGSVVVGGFVYRGSALPQLYGRYIFGDWSTSFRSPEGRLFLAKSRSDGLWKVEEFSISTSEDKSLHHYILGFGQDLSGELYLLTKDNSGPTGNTGQIFKLVNPSGK